MSRLLVLGDIHGAARALDQVLNRAHFDPSSDRLIFLGDVCDGWSETPRAINLLLSIPNRTIILGNHDEWMLDWVRGRGAPPEWWHQGGKATVQAYSPKTRSWLEASYLRNSIPESHEVFLTTALPYHIEGTLAFTHGGFAVSHSVRQRRSVDFPPPGGYNWDRWMWEQARAGTDVLPNNITEVFIGHTTTESYSLKPVHAGSVWNLDQGAFP